MKLLWQQLVYALLLCKSHCHVSWLNSFQGRNPSAQSYVLAGFKIP